MREWEGRVGYFFDFCLISETILVLNSGTDFYFYACELRRRPAFKNFLRSIDFHPVGFFWFLEACLKLVLSSTGILKYWIRLYSINRIFLYP